jgi:predicted nucleotidyltransferase
MNTGLTSSDLTIIQTTIQSFSGVDAAILFGSRAKGTYKKGSDIDIAIKLSDTSSTSLNEIHESLEENTPLPYFFDVIDYDTIQSKDLTDHINRVGIAII